MAVLLLLFIGLFRLSDIAMGVMANPFYIDMGFSKDQIADFISCIKSRQQPICHAGVGASSAIACHLMNFGYWHGAKAKWNPTEHKFISGGDDKWLTREYRGEWKV
jgi:hypothetical protein